MNPDQLERLESCKKAFERDAESIGVLCRNELERREDGDYQLARVRMLFNLYCAAIAEGANRVVNILNRRKP